MADNRDKEIDDDGPVQHTAEHDFTGGLKKDGTDVADTNDTYTDEEAQDAVGNNVGDGLAYDDAAAEIALNDAASGNVTLSSGAATIDTGVSEATTATFLVALGPSTDDSEITASIDANSGGNYEVHLDEINTSVGNPTVEYDIIRVR
jgi:hypothetical protein